jgi:four helix bundle protein
MQTGPSRNYRDLLAWQKAMALVKSVYEVTREFPRTERFTLTDQVRRAAISVPSNVAEGQARRSPREFAHYVRLALGSLAELDTQLVIARELGYVNGSASEAVEAQVVEVRKMLNGLLSSLRLKSGGQPAS